MSFPKLKIAIIGVAIMSAVSTIAHTTLPLGPVPMDKPVRSLNYSDGQFKNLRESLDMSISDVAATTWDFFFYKNSRTPDISLPIRKADLTHFSQSGRDQLNVTWLGHSSLLINMDGYKIMTDPVFEKRISILGPTRFNGEVPVKIDALPDVDGVIISHDHYDHLNKYTVRKLAPKTKKFLVPLGVGARLVKWGIPREKIVELDWWEDHFDKDLRVAATPSQHFSGRGLTDRNLTLWASWVITTPRHRVFFSGDSGYFDGFKRIGESYGPFNMAFMECGAYNTAWPDVHMFPEQTVQAHLDLNADILHPIHWGTFNLALHPWYEPMERLTAAAAARGVPIAIPMVGETTRYGEFLPTTPWWRQAGTETKSTEEPTTHGYGG
jgi:L-ascorbate metabolism protein UlaG (beta-lactamase superfamily)